MVGALMLFPAGVGATDAEVLQKDLKIQDVFQRYGRKKNVTMVELSNEMLETYGMTRYKSITIKNGIRMPCVSPVSVWRRPERRP